MSMKSPTERFQPSDTRPSLLGARLAANAPNLAVATAISILGGVSLALTLFVLLRPTPNYFFPLLRDVDEKHPEGVVLRLSFALATALLSATTVAAACHFRGLHRTYSQREAKGTQQGATNACDHEVLEAPFLCNAPCADVSHEQHGVRRKTRQRAGVQPCATGVDDLPPQSAMHSHVSVALGEGASHAPGLPSIVSLSDYDGDGEDGENALEPQCPSDTELTSDNRHDVGVGPVRSDHRPQDAYLLSVQDQRTNGTLTERLIHHDILPVGDEHGLPRAFALDHSMGSRSWDLRRARKRIWARAQKPKAMHVFGVGVVAAVCLLIHATATQSNLRIFSSFSAADDGLVNSQNMLAPLRVSKKNVLYAAAGIWVPMWMFLIWYFVRLQQIAAKGKRRADANRRRLQRENRRNRAATAAAAAAVATTTHQVHDFGETPEDVSSNVTNASRPTQSDLSLSTSASTTGSSSTPGNSFVGGTDRETRRARLSWLSVSRMAHDLQLWLLPGSRRGSIVSAIVAMMRPMCLSVQTVAVLKVVGLTYALDNFAITENKYVELTLQAGLAFAEYTAAFCFATFLIILAVDMKRAAPAKSRTRSTTVLHDHLSDPQTNV